MRLLAWLGSARFLLELPCGRQRPGIQRKAGEMWNGFDPELRRELEGIRGMVSRRHQTPTREWPLIFVEEEDVLFVMREWPDGSITAYATSEYSDKIRGDDGTGTR